MAASSLTEVRWACKFEGVNSIVRRFKAILVSLQKIAASNSNQSDVAAGLYHRMLSGRFIISICFLHRVLAIINGLSKAMQESNIKWISIASEMLAVRQLLQDLNVDGIIDAAESLCSSVGIPTTFEDPIHTQRETAEDPGSQIKFCEGLKEHSIPLILEELDRRFNNVNVDVLAAMDALDASKERYLDHQTMCPLVSRFEDCLTVDVGLLKSECERAL